MVPVGRNSSGSWDIAARGVELRRNLAGGPDLLSRGCEQHSGTACAGPASSGVDQILARGFHAADVYGTTLGRVAAGRDSFEARYQRGQSPGLEAAHRSRGIVGARPGGSGGVCRLRGGLRRRPGVGGSAGAALDGAGRVTSHGTARGGHLSGTGSRANSRPKRSHTQAFTGECTVITPVNAALAEAAVCGDRIRPSYGLPGVVGTSDSDREFKR